MWPKTSPKKVCDLGSFTLYAYTLIHPLWICKSCSKYEMEFVRDNHTYINRVESLQQVFKIKMNT